MSQVYTARDPATEPQRRDSIIDIDVPNGNDAGRWAERYLVLAGSTLAENDLQITDMEARFALASDSTRSR
jgi:hypothetical protein